MAKRTYRREDLDSREADEIAARAEHNAVIARIQAQNAADRAADPAKWAEIERKNAIQREQDAAFRITARNSVDGAAHYAQRLSDVALEQSERQADWEQVKLDAAEDAAL